MLIQQRPARCALKLTVSGCPKAGRKMFVLSTAGVPIQIPDTVVGVTIGPQGEMNGTDQLGRSVFSNQIEIVETDTTQLEKLGNSMYQLASEMPGFISYKDFAAPDGEYVSIVEFESLETLAAWRNHPEHKEAQRQGRERYFSKYHIQVCTTVRDYWFPFSG